MLSVAQFFLFCFGIVVVLSTVIPPSNDAEARHSPMTAFRNFIALNHRNYTNDEETAKRFEIFEKNLAYINSLNAKYNGTIFGVTEFADYTLEELQKVGMKLPVKEDDLLMIPYAEKVDSAIPDSFDWRDRGMVTSVKHQGGCNSCWAFAAVAVVETMNAIRNGELIDLSVQEAIDCAGNSHGCVAGYPSSAYRVAIDKGLMREQEYPYFGYQQSTCPPELGSVFAQSIQRIGYSADEIAHHVSNHGPVSVTPRATASFFYYADGIYQPTAEECSISTYYHAMTIVGFGETNGQKYWILKNSFGPHWGVYGYIYYARGNNDCDIERYAFSATV